MTVQNFGHLCLGALYLFCNVHVLADALQLVIHVGKETNIGLLQVQRSVPNAF